MICLKSGTSGGTVGVGGTGDDVGEGSGVDVAEGRGVADGVMVSVAGTAVSGTAVVHAASPAKSRQKKITVTLRIMWSLLMFAEQVALLGKKIFPKADAEKRVIPELSDWHFPFWHRQGGPAFTLPLLPP